MPKEISPFLCPSIRFTADDGTEYSVKTQNLFKSEYSFLVHYVQQEHGQVPKRAIAKIRINGFSNETVKEMASFINRNQCDASEENVLELLRASDKYNMVRLFKVCEKYMLTRLDKKNMGRFLLASQRYAFSSYRKFLEFAAKHFALAGEIDERTIVEKCKRLANENNNGAARPKTQSNPNRGGDAFG